MHLYTHSPEHMILYPETLPLRKVLKISSEPYSYPLFLVTLHFHKEKIYIADSKGNMDIYATPWYGILHRNKIVLKQNPTLPKQCGIVKVIGNVLMLNSWNKSRLEVSERCLWYNCEKSKVFSFDISQSTFTGSLKDPWFLCQIWLTARIYHRLSAG